MRRDSSDVTIPLRSSWTRSRSRSAVSWPRAVAPPARLGTGSSHADLRFHRHAGAQPVEARSALFETQPHRDALHHLHVVAAGVLGREQAVARAGGAGEALHRRAVVVVERIDVHRGLLAGAHVADLRLAEVGGDPELAHLRDGEELLARLHAVAHVDRALA